MNCLLTRSFFSIFQELQQWKNRKNCENSDALQNNDNTAVDIKEVSTLIIFMV